MTESINPIVDPPDLKAETVFDSTSRYRLERRLGEGGMGEVWLAERMSAGRHSQKVAIKFLCNASEGRALAAEALRMSRLSHDNIVPFVDSGRDNGGRFFVVMTYVDGVDLEGLRELVGLTSEAVYEGRPLTRVPDPIVGFIMFMVLRALHYAHTYHFEDGAVGLIHRDVSPGNILIGEEGGFVKLTDFGVAVRQCHEAAQTDVAGKVPYMAPEVLRGGVVDTRSDIYALGLVVYELLTGFNPNVHPSGLVSVVSAITNVMLAIEKPLIPPHEIVRGIDPDLSRILTRMLATSPVDRYPSAESVIADLSVCLYDHGVGPTTGSLGSYLKLLRDPDCSQDGRVRRALQFLAGPDGEPDVRPRWELTPRAARAATAGNNPGRA